MELSVVLSHTRWRVHQRLFTASTQLKSVSRGGWREHGTITVVFWGRNNSGRLHGFDQPCGAVVADTQMTLHA